MPISDEAKAAIANKLVSIAGPLLLQFREQFDEAVSQAWDELAEIVGSDISDDELDAQISEAVVGFLIGLAVADAYANMSRATFMATVGVIAQAAKFNDEDN